ncbi:MAG: hypothetical protein GY801_44685 [bacterium]|nr:hypothetical protein [bacterium]
MNFSKKTECCLVQMLQWTGAAEKSSPRKPIRSVEKMTISGMERRQIFNENILNLLHRA